MTKNINFLKRCNINKNLKKCLCVLHKEKLFAIWKEKPFKNLLL